MTRRNGSPRPSSIGQLIEAECFALLLGLAELRDDLNDFFADDDGSDLPADELVVAINTIGRHAHGLTCHFGALLDPAMAAMN